MSWIAKILPREEKFYGYLREMTAESTSSAHLLKAFVESGDTQKRAEISAAIRASKSKAKAVMAEVTRQLCLTFITPFDREDIQDFSLHLYKIPKTIDKARQYIELHHIASLPELSEQLDVILEEAEAMDKLVQALIRGGKTKEIMRLAALLDELENKGDDVLSKLMVKLLRDTTDARELILRKDLYDMLERIIDRFRNAAEQALEIALKNS